MLMKQGCLDKVFDVARMRLHY